MTSRSLAAVGSTHRGWEASTRAADEKKSVKEERREPAPKRWCCQSLSLSLLVVLSPCASSSPSAGRNDVENSPAHGKEQQQRDKPVSDSGKSAAARKVSTRTPREPTDLFAAGRRDLRMQPQPLEEVRRAAFGLAQHVEVGQAPEGGLVFCVAAGVRHAPTRIFHGRQEAADWELVEDVRVSTGGRRQRVRGWIST